jgi:hypothetical protein
MIKVFAVLNDKKYLQPPVAKTALISGSVVIVIIKMAIFQNCQSNFYKDNTIVGDYAMIRESQIGEV